MRYLLFAQIKVVFNFNKKQIKIFKCEFDLQRANAKFYRKSIIEQ